MRNPQFLAALALVSLTTPAYASTVPANAEAWQTLPGAASITLNFGAGNVVIPLEGAEFGAPFTDPHYPLTAAEVARLNSLAPNLGSVQYLFSWTGPNGSVAGTTASQQIGQTESPSINTTPNFDTVIQRLNTSTFTSGGQVQETQIKILMLNLQSVAPVVIGGFHYELIETLANGSPVFDPTDLSHPQFLGNLKLDSTSIDGGGGVHGTLDLGVTGPTPTAANLGADLPSGMEGLPVNFDIQFIPLDGGPALSDQRGETIFQNQSSSSFSPVPEPSCALLVIGSLGLIAAARRRAPGD